MQDLADQPETAVGQGDVGAEPDETGTYAGLLDLPDDLAPGEHTVFAIGDDRAAIAPIRTASADDVVLAVLAAVEVVDGPTPVPTGERLPATGTDPLPLTVVALVTLALGTGLVCRSRAGA